MFSYNYIFALTKKLTNLTWVLINRLLLYLPIVILICLILILAFNSPRGFDITDDSYYLLWAEQPHNVLASTTQFGFYTRLLYLLSGQNIALFRILGILTLLSATSFFALSMERYWAMANSRVFVFRKRWKVLPPVLIGALSYYGFWLITPSYNWMALFSVLITGAGLLRVTTIDQSGSNKNSTLHISILEGFTVGIGGGLAFMAKPTSAAVLAAVALFWLAVNPISGRQLKVFLGTATCVSSLFIVAHAIIFAGSLELFYRELRLGVESVHLLGAGHTIGNLSLRTVNDLKQIPIKVFRVTPAGFLLFPIFWWVIWFLNARNYKTYSKLVLSFFLMGFNLYTWYRIWDMGAISLTNIGFVGIVFTFALVMSAFLTLCALRKTYQDNCQIPFTRLILLCFFLFMLALSQAFGSGNRLIRQISLAYVFFATAATYLSSWIDQCLDRKILSNMVPALVSIVVVLVMMNAYEHPYRLPYNIGEQIVESSVLMGGSSLKVDAPTGKYIDTLKKIALKAGWKPKTPLIDLTGGSPGATVILGGKITGFPWLPGNYKGSDEFA